MTGFRMDVHDFERTQPVVMPPEPQPEMSVICGDTAWDRLVIALTLVGVAALLAVCSGCGGGDPEDEPEPAKCQQIAPPPGKTVTQGACA